MRLSGTERHDRPFVLFRRAPCHEGKASPRCRAFADIGESSNWIIKKHYSEAGKDQVEFGLDSQRVERPICRQTLDQSIAKATKWQAAPCSCVAPYPRCKFAAAVLA